MAYKIEFNGPIRGHHVYKDCWAPRLDEKLSCKPDPREEAQSYDKYALGVFKRVSESDNEKLVGHIPIELSQLLYHFLNTGENGNKLTAAVVGKRKREIGLIVPAKFTATTKHKKFAEILLKNLEEKKELLEIHICKADIVKIPCFTEQML